MMNWLEIKEIRILLFIFLTVCNPFLWISVQCSERVEVCGEAVILNGDQSAAKRFALLDARMQAIEKVVGVQLSSETILQNELIVESLLELKSSGHITNETILKETRFGDLFKVCIRADVEKGKAEKKVRELIGQTRVILLTEERIQGVPAQQSIIGERLKEQLKQAQFEVVDETYFAALWAHDHSNSNLSQAEKMKRFSQALFAGLVVVVTADVTPSNTSESVNPYGMKELKKAKAASAFGSIRVFLGDNGLIIAEKSFDRLAGFDLTSLHSASEKSLVRAGKDLGKWLVPSLTKYLGSNQRKVDIIFEKTPGNAFLDKAAAALNLHRWATLVEIVEDHPGGQSRISLSYADKTLYLANFLEHLSLPGGLGFPEHTRMGPNILVYQFN